MIECIRCGRDTHEPPPDSEWSRVIVPPPCCDGCDRMMWQCFCVPVKPPVGQLVMGLDL